MKKTLIPLLLAIFLAIPTVQAVEYDKGMKAKQIDAAIEKAVLDFQFECLWICGGNSIRVTKGSDGQFRTADNVIIKETDVHCFGKKPIDKVARAQRTADEAKAGNKKAQDTANSAKTIGKKAQATADEAVGRLNALLDDQGACLDSVRALRDELTLMISSRYTTLNTSYTDLDVRFQQLKTDMPSDQSAAVDSLQDQVSGLEDWNEVWKALGYSTHSHKLDKIIERARAIDPNTKIVKHAKR